MIAPTRVARRLAFPLAAALALVSCSSGDGPADSPATPSDTSGAGETETPSAAEPSTPPTPPTPLGPAEIDAACTSEADPIDRVGPEQVDGPVVVLGPDGSPLCLGPVALSGDVIETAQATLDPSGTWVVGLVFTADGINRFNEIAQLCYDRVAGVCPSGRLALLVDGRVGIAPSINAPSFQPDQIQIDGHFTQDEATALAEASRGGGVTFQPVLTDLA